MRAVELPSVPTNAGSILTVPPPRDLFLNRDARGRVAQRSYKRGVNLDGAAAEELADAVADGCVQCATEQRAGGGIGALLHLLLLVELRFLLGAAEGEQREDVGFAEWRFGAVGGLEIAHGALQADRDVVGFHARCGVDVDGRIDAHRIAEVDVPALQLVLGAGKGGASVRDLNATENGGLRDGAADGEVNGAGMGRAPGG